MAECALVLPIPSSLAADPGAAFLPFAGSAAVAHCVRRASGPSALVDQVVIAVADCLAADVEASLAEHDIAAVDVISVQDDGGRRRCLTAALEVIEPSVRYILVHDVRFPLATADLGRRILAKLRNGHEVVVPALEMVDSVKALDRDGTVVSSVDRTTLRSAQFPTGFERACLHSALQSHTSPALDELEATMLAGAAITIIDGDRSAPRLELPRDAELAGAIWHHRQAGAPSGASAS